MHQVIVNGIEIILTLLPVMHWLGYGRHFRKTVFPKDKPELSRNF